MAGSRQSHRRVPLQCPTMGGRAQKVCCSTRHCEGPPSQLARRCQWPDSRHALNQPTGELPETSLGGASASQPGWLGNAAALCRCSSEWNLRRPATSLALPSVVSVLTCPLFCLLEMPHPLPPDVRGEVPETSENCSTTKQMVHQKHNETRWRSWSSRGLLSSNFDVRDIHATQYVFKKQT